MDIMEKKNNELWQLFDLNGRDAAWVSEHFGPICQMLLNTQLVPDRPLDAAKS
ncbi:MAG: hypothetical protein WB799_18270 [Candidatus Sulfotelmatobacter sp.]